MPKSVKITIPDDLFMKIEDMRAKVRPIPPLSRFILHLLQNALGETGTFTLSEKVETIQSEKGKIGEMEERKEGKSENRPTKKQLGYLESLIDKVLARGEASQVLVEALDWLKENAESLTKDEISKVIEDLKEERYGNVVSLVDGKRYG